jgi:restriction system protein
LVYGGALAKRNPESPWNPARPAHVSPEEYEKQVVAWLNAAGQGLNQFQVRHLQHLRGDGGDYEFDAIAEFTVLNGARIIILVECKRYSRPVERDKLLSLWAKLKDVNAHKAMMFATCGFQEGALEYARTYGIATIAFVEGEFLFETASAHPSDHPTPHPSWLRLPKFAGILVSKAGEKIECVTIDQGRTQVLSEWLNT